MSRLNLQEEIRRITNETAAAASAKALEVAEQAKQRAAEVSSQAIAKALDASTLAAEKAAQAAVAAAQLATATSLDLSYIKADISSTKMDIKSINEKLDNKYLSKEEFRPTKDVVEVLDREKLNIRDSYAVLYKPENERVHFDHETRMRSLENSVTRIATWGTAGVLAISVIEFVLSRFVK